MGIIKNSKIVSPPGGGGTIDPTIETRLSTLEDNESKVAYFVEINASSGTITKPTGSTILLNQFPGGVDAYVSTISSGQPTGENPVTSAGVLVDVTSFDASGNFTLSGTPSAYPVALIYIIKIPAASWSNLTVDNILEEEDLNPEFLDNQFTIKDNADQTKKVQFQLSGITTATTRTLSSPNADGTLALIAQTITNGNTATAPSEDAVFDALALKGTRYTKFFQWSSLASPADATIYYVGNLSSLSLGDPGAGAIRNMRFGAEGTLKEAYFTTVITNNPTTELVTMYLRNLTTSTDYTIGTFNLSIGASSLASFIFTGLSISVNTSDSYTVKFLTPTWSTNPSAWFGAGELYIL